MTKASEKSRSPVAPPIGKGARANPKRPGALDPNAAAVRPLTLFYSWQSDLPDLANRNGIRDALRGVRKAIKGEIDLLVDEATRDTPGSPNIPNKIFEKIRACDVFVADVTTITGMPYAGRPCANPNVVFELGYAVAQVGWERIILLVNTDISSLKDLPFDFDRHRAMTYTLAMKPAPDQMKALQASLKVGVEVIAKHNPPRPRDLEGLSPRDLRRKRDLGNITWALEQVHQPSLDYFIETMPYQFLHKIFWYYESFKGVVNSSLFYISDPNLAKLFRAWLEGWDHALSGGEHFEMASNPDLYIWTSDRHPKGNRAKIKIRDGVTKMEAARRAILSEVRSNYIEIDINATNKTAFESWQKNQYRE
jgi:hypothetical protein